MEPWFDTKTAGLVGGVIGSTIGILGAIIGCTCWICVQKGWKKFIYSIFVIAITMGYVLLAIGLVAIKDKQPYHVWYPLLYPGVLETVLFTIFLFIVRRRFTQNELKKMQAKDL